MAGSRLIRLALALFAASAVLAAAKPAGAASLEEEIAKLLDDHPGIRAAGKTVESTRQAIDTALAAFYPRVTASADVGMEVIDNPSERQQGDGQGGKPSSRTPQTFNISMTQNLFNGGASAAGVRTARLNVELARKSLEGTRQNIVFEGITAYVNVLRQRRLIELALENEGTIQQQLNLEDERVQRGSGVTVDVLQAKSRLQVSKERRVTFEGGLRDAVTRYTQVFNRPPDLDSMVDPVPPVDMVPSDVERAVDTALVGNPALGNTAVNIEVIRERRRTIMAEMFPTLDLQSQWNFEKHASGTIGVRRDYSVLLVANWNLFTGLSTRSQMAQSTFDLGASKDNHDLTIRKVIEQTKLAWQALLTVRDRLQLLENAVNIAAEVFASRQKLREAGKETVINVLDAENEVNNAQINYTSASYDERLAVYQLLLAMGLLSPQGLDIY